LIGKPTHGMGKLKRIALFLDGTWNTLDAPHATNVVKLAEATCGVDTNGISQVIHYDEGVGTSQSIAPKTESWLGGAFGIGLEKNVEQAYRFLIFNYDPGDEIYIFGFSRGAFTARTLVGLLRNCGIVSRNEAHRVQEAINLYKSRSPDMHPDKDEACRFRSKYSTRNTVSRRDLDWRAENVSGFDENGVHPLEVKFLGVWDTVGAMGVPNHIPVLSNIFNRRHKFHDAKLTGLVKNARHALGLDERRRIFTASPWDDEKLDFLAKDAALEGRPDAYQQKWFPGDHGSVGGGGDVMAQSDNTLGWIAEAAANLGLAIDPDFVSRLKPNALGPLKNITKKGFKPLDVFASKVDRGGPSFPEQVSNAAIDRWQTHASELPEGKAYRPGSLGKVKTAAVFRDRD
jgi:uncharacterized protein (DUF2235 family)